MSKFEAPSTQTVLATPKRAFVFLAALGMDAELQDEMNQHGYRPEDHEEGWRLLLKASSSKIRFVGRQSLAAAAIQALDAWDEVGFLKAQAALVHRFPAQAEFIFADLGPSQGPAAVLGVATFLDRLDALEKGTGREDTRDADAKALELLAIRGIGTDERARLRALIGDAQLAPKVDPQGTAALEAAHEVDMLALYAWYFEWSERARAIFTNRAARIQLGIAKRRKPNGDEVEEPVSPAPAVAANAPGGAG